MFCDNIAKQYAIFNNRLALYLHIEDSYPVQQVLHAH